MEVQLLFRFSDHLLQLWLSNAITMTLLLEVNNFRLQLDVSIFKLLNLIIIDLTFVAEIEISNDG